MLPNEGLVDRIANKEQVQIFLDSAVCIIHQDIVLDAHECDKCEAVFCKPCVDVWINKFNQKKCPNCKDVNFKMQPVGRKFRNSLSAIKFHCENKAKGCEEIIPYDNVVEHKNNCKFAEKECPGCNQKFLISALSEHQSDCKESLKLELLQEKLLREKYQEDCSGYSKQIKNLAQRCSLLEQANKGLTGEIMRLQKELDHLKKGTGQSTKHDNSEPQVSNPSPQNIPSSIPSQDGQQQQQNNPIEEDKYDNLFAEYGDQPSKSKQDKPSQELKVLLYGDEAGELNCFDLQTEESIFQKLVAVGQPVHAVTFYKEKEYIAVPNESGDVLIYSLGKNVQYVRTISTDITKIRFLVFSPDGQHLIVGSDQNLRFIKFSTGSAILKVEVKSEKEETKLIGLFFSSNDTLFSVRRSSVAAHQIPSGKNVAQTSTAQFCEGTLVAAAMSPNTELLAFGYTNGTITLVSCTSLQIFTFFVGIHTASSSHEIAILFTSNSEKMISAATDGLIMISNVKTGNVDNVINTGIKGDSILKEPSLLLLVAEEDKIIYVSTEKKIVIIELSNLEIQKLRVVYAMHRRSKENANNYETKKESALVLTAKQSISKIRAK